ncbi:hypothetical protein HXX76_011287 [Chlamydomonas incerta]|uniref:Protein kinase domain-containing protein n=1 Tax=Chlamydomonas incerta TaxID=51695 RepID=A0A835SYD8_CHLIN|nr:hypothetical protein HXX76_011287 [Chlamydomonas incerta]|eukprot:KAG2429045.1 hypothetical protein HXX76_011287 [Chlamydomonas incerta]
MHPAAGQQDVSYYVDNGVFVRRLGKGGFGRADLCSITSPHDGSSQLVPHHLVMEYVPGGNLDKYMDYLALENCDRKGTLMSYKKLRKLAAHMLEALALLHSKGVCHCDLKPDNILLGEDEDGGMQFKLADFGVAQVCAGSEVTSGVSCTELTS